VEMLLHFYVTIFERNLSLFIGQTTFSDKAYKRSPKQRV